MRYGQSAGQARRTQFLSRLKALQQFLWIGELSGFFRQSHQVAQHRAFRLRGHRRIDGATAEHFRQDGFMRQKLPCPARGLLMILLQPLLRQAQNALRRPRINVAFAEDHPVAALFKRNLPVLDPLLHIGAGQVQITGGFFKAEQLIWHKSPASTEPRLSSHSNGGYTICQTNGHPNLDRQQHLKHGCTG